MVFPATKRVGESLRLSLTVRSPSRAIGFKAWILVHTSLSLGKARGISDECSDYSDFVSPNGSRLFVTAGFPYTPLQQAQCDIKVISYARDLQMGSVGRPRVVINYLNVRDLVKDLQITDPINSILTLDGTNVCSLLKTSPTNWFVASPAESLQCGADPVAEGGRLQPNDDEQRQLHDKAVAGQMGLVAPRRGALHPMEELQP